MMHLFDRLSSRLNSEVELVVAAMGMAMAAIVIVQVFSRYALNHSLFWSEEAARYLLVWITFLGASIAYRRKAHPGVDFLVVRLTPPLRRLARLLVHLTSLAFFSVMIVSGCRFAWFVRLQISPALALPKWIVLAVIPISGTVFFIHGLSFLIATMGGRAGEH